MVKVQAYVYDLSNGLAKVMSPMLLGKTIDLVPHTGIVIDGNREYFFGGGIRTGQPKKCVGMEPAEIIELGESEKTEAELVKWLKTQNDDWTPEKYDLLDRNCNHFANAVSQFLEVRELPNRIVNVATVAFGQPKGSVIRDLISKYEKKLREQEGVTSDPFAKSPK
jgi:hypothetical protein